MNFLAHLFLSREFNREMLGNFIADAVKGKSMYSYHPEIIKGIELHRKIDKFTDFHPLFCKSKKRAQAKNGKFSGVIVDIFYDHFLAADFDKYSQIPLKQFASNAYNLLKKNYDILPIRVKTIYPYMVQNDWLYSYSKLEGIQRTLAGLSKRTTFQNNMAQALPDLIQYYSEYKNEFTFFFEDLQNFVHSLNIKVKH